MASPSYAILFSAVVSGAASAGGAGTVLIPDAVTGQFVIATTANRGSRRSTGLALASFIAGGTVEIQQSGQIDSLTAGLGPGAASYVRVSTLGLLERATPSTGDDVCGFVEVDGTFHALFGILTAAIVNGSGGAPFTPPTGTGLVSVTGGVLNAAALANPGAGTFALQAIGGVVQWVNQSAAPTLTSVSTSGGNVGDIAGGYPATLTGTGFTGATGVTFGGTAATSVVVVSSTSITCVVPAHATGAISVIVTTSAGSNSANTAFRYFSPAELALTFWVRGPYPGSAPWSSTASAGASLATGGYVANAGDPSSGTSVNSYVPAKYLAASSQSLRNTSTGGQSNNLFAAGGGTIAGLFMPSATVAASGNLYDDPALFVDAGVANTVLSLTNSGFQVVVTDSGAYKARAVLPATPLAWHSFIGKWDGTNLNMQVDATSAAPLACGPVTLSTANLGTGRGYGGGYVSGSQLEMICAAFAFTTQNAADYRSYLNTKYFPAGAQV